MLQSSSLQCRKLNFTAFFSRLHATSRGDSASGACCYFGACYHVQNLPPRSELATNFQSLLPPSELAAASRAFCHFQRTFHRLQNLPLPPELLTTSRAYHCFTCSELDPTLASWYHPTDRPTDRLHLPAWHGANLDLIYQRNMKQAQKWHTSRAWSESRPDPP